MRKDRLYLYTFLSIAIIFVIIGGFATQYFVQASANEMLSSQLESSKREAREISILIGIQLENGIEKKDFIDTLQNAINNSNKESLGFISIIDWSGKVICHPNRPQIGTTIDQNNSANIAVDGEFTADQLFDLVKKGNSSQDASEIIHLNAVPNSDWLVASHANIGLILQRFQSLRDHFYLLFSVMGFIMILSSVFMVRLIGSVYEKRLETKNQELESEVINLAKLNSDLGKYKKRVIEEKPKVEEISSEEDQEVKETNKKRILTYLRNELLTVSVEDIAFIYTENTITYVVDMTGKRSTTNSSLDELYSGFDSNYFYRANRQFIIAITAIDKIIRYGNNQLKIVVNPNSELDIIIGKNKAAEFKQWLNS
ncbi:LytR/AlgR family response regulator transcription factor [Croceivirga sp. JEA036]|uniref:LytR/AlgR family response regulator transcription factor n=1 Tax=Croceivirga sp. JEA036 TaxID=2721162 RepID=UPI00143B8C6A|nr:LytTR family DNA-binding domain-containing protein [Croceivirga sp. JEA036]NJB35090.1 LytTR family transcriptional regulator [Croceivirga sp. JEA036]